MPEPEMRQRMVTCPLCQKQTEVITANEFIFAKRVTCGQEFFITNDKPVKLPV
jgi:hypothetical protein